MSKQAVPDGYMEDVQGRLVPMEVISPIDQARNDLVREIITKARALQEVIKQFKERAMGDVEAFVALSAERYGVNLGGVKGNVSLLSFDGQYKILRAMADTLVFDERLQAAKQLVDECLREWTKDSRAELRALVENAFQVDKEGKINTGRVLALRNLDIKDERWKRAMQAVSDSLQVAGTRAYLRLYERVGRSTSYRQIPLDLSAL